MGNPLSKAVKLVSLARASVPVAYVQLGLDVATDRGIARDQLLKGVVLAPGVLDRPDGRVPLAQCVRLVSRVARRTGDRSLGYEFGLRNNLAAHGDVGYGLMSHATVGEAIAFGLKYGRLRNPILRLNLFAEDGQGVIEAREAFPLGPLGQYAFDAVLVTLARLARQLGGRFQPQLELRFACREPAHFERYRHRLPPVRFSAGANQLRFPADYLQRPLHTANASSARLVASQCARDLTLLGEDADVAERVRAVLGAAQGTYPGLEFVAARLHMSGRSLKRKLQQEGRSFLELLDEARRSDSVRLLSDPQFGINQIAERVGYTDPASFTRAFRKWTGQTPTAYRESLGG